jgi:serine/threonine protein kinase/tetratricopeptide (TPR) repeat protein
MTLAVGTKLGRYEIRSKLGKGGMGEVYLAQDAKLDRKVALKILPAEVASHRDRMERFVREAKAAAALNQPNIAHIYEIGERAGVNFIAMEFVQGETLDASINGKPLELKEALAVATQIAEGLSEAHGHGIIHRDIKPGNIMIAARSRVKVMDFGLAKVIEAREAINPEAETKNLLTGPGPIIGTMPYMSPEQVKGERLDARTDIFSFGVLLYEMLTGQQPFVADSGVATISAILTKEPPPLAQYLAECPEELQRIVRKCLEKDRERRYQTMRDVALDLDICRREHETAQATGSRGERITGGAAVTTTPSDVRKRKSLLSRRALIAGAGLLTLLVTVALAYVFVFRRGATTTPRLPEIRSLAVLPLKSLDAGENYLGLGITDAVIRRISQTGELTVRPTSAVRRYLSEDTDALTAARQLNADAVLEGSVQRADDRLRVSVNLLRVSDGTSLWADSFDMRMTDIFTIQDTVAQQVATRLRLQLDQAQQARFTKRYTSNPIAYDYYVKGMYSLDQRGWSIEDKPQMEATIALFKQAISADPQYALAHAQLAYAYAWMAIFIEPDLVWVEHARQEMRQAEALDSQLAETHVARHLILWSVYEGFQTEAAIHELLLAQQLNPSIGHLELGVIYWHNGLEDQAGRELQRAIEIDPTNEKVKEELYNSTALSGRIDEALAVQQRFFNTGPDLKYYLEKNRLNDAQPLLEQALAKEPNDPALRLRKALFLALKEDFHGAEAEIPWILEHIPKNRSYHHNTYEIARVYALAGKSQEAIKWLRETAETGLPSYPLFERDPYLNRIRQAPDFIQFMSEMKAQNERYRREFGEGATR